MNEKQEYWNKRVQDTQVKLNKLAWAFAQAGVNLTNNFTAEYNALKEDEKRFMESSANSSEIEQAEPTESEVEENQEVTAANEAEASEMSDVSDDTNNGDGETAVTN